MKKYLILTLFFNFLIVNMTNITFAKANDKTNDQKNGKINDENQVKNKVQNQVQDTLKSLKVKTRVDHSTITTSDEVLFTIKLTRPLKSKFKMPEFGEAIQGFRIVDYGQKKNIEAGLKVERYWYKLRADLKGSYVLPSIAISVENNGKSKVIKTAEIFIEVKSRLNNKNKKNKKGDKNNLTKDHLKDIKNIIKSKMKLTNLSWGLIFLLLLIVMLVVYFKLLKKTKVEDNEVEISPYEEVLSLFKKLDNLNLDLKEGGKQFSYQLSYLLRNYLERQYGVNATDMTLNQIQKSLRKMEFTDDNNKSSLLFILKEMDLIKYSTISKNKDELLQFLTKGKEFIEQIKPKDQNESNEESVI